MINRTVLYRDVNVSSRTNANVLNYHVNDFSDDEHVKDPTDISPFVKINFPMVTGFIIYPMHTAIEGALGRRLEG
jgi:hypothetical protein